MVVKKLYLLICFIFILVYIILSSKTREYAFLLSKNKVIIKMPYNNIFHKRSNFPEIFVGLPETYNGWIQVVRTDSKKQNLQLFIDPDL